MRKLDTDSNRQRVLASEIVPTPSARDMFNFRAAVSNVTQVTSLAMCALVDTYEDIEDLMEQYAVLLTKGISRTRFIPWVQHVLRRSLEETTAISFDDMVYLPAKLGLRTGNYDNVFFDEAQDGNRAQEELVLNAVKPGGKIVVVGDDRQAIYVFRGAGAGAFARLIERLDADVLPLSMTFRCPKKVVKLVQPLVPDFEASPDAPEGLLTWNSLEDLFEEIRPGHALISRSNYYLTKVSMALLKRGVRVKIVGKDIGQRLQTLVDKSEATHINDMLEWLTKYVTTESERLVAAGKDSQAEEIADAAEALREITDGMTDVHEIQRKLSELFVDAAPDGFVRASTVHKAKGLQWTDVWMIEASFKLNSTEGENLYYVAATRTLWTPTHPGHLRLVQMRKRDGTLVPSIGTELLEWQRRQDEEEGPIP
jgi:DNA helicase-2/ATP-dependent DNA helicase PcrA